MELLLEKLNSSVLSMSPPPALQAVVQLQSGQPKLQMEVSLPLLCVMFTFTFPIHSLGV